MLFSFLRAISVGAVLAAMVSSLGVAQAAGPLRTGETRTVKLEAPWVYMTTGGAGRYLVFHLKEVGKLAVLDVVAGEVTKTIDAPGDELKLAAGMDKLVVYVPAQKIFHRYDLATLKREKSSPAPPDFNPRTMVMGTASQGPLICHEKVPVVLFDLQTLKPITLQGEVLSGGRFGDHGYDLTVSSDGQTIIGWIPGLSGQQYFMMKLNGTETSIKKTSDAYSYASRYLLPSADGSLFFRDGGAEIFDADLKSKAVDLMPGFCLLPTDDPNYFLAAKETSKTDAEAWICACGTQQKIAHVNNVGHILEGLRNTDKGRWGFEPRLRWLPEANTLVSLPHGEQEVLLQGANLKELLDQTGEEYLHIVSKPPPQAWIGEQYTYKLEVLSSAKKVEFELASAPDGLKLSRGGQVKWTPKAKPVGGIEQVVIGVSADGKQAFQNFAISVDWNPNDSAANVPAGGTGALAGQPQMKPGSPASPSPGPTASRKPMKIDDSRLEIPAGPFALGPGAGYRTHLLMQGNVLTVLAADGVTPEKTVTFQKPYVRIAEREKYYVGVSRDPWAVEQIDKQTLEVTKSVKFTAQDATDIVLHPTRPITYVAHKFDISFPRYRFLVYDEAKGEGRVSDEYLGKYLAIDPGGRFLIAGYSDIYEEGSRFIFNPDRIHVVPSYGSVDWLLRFDLDRQGMPQPSDIHKKAGGNGKGIRLSRDGKRVSYVSVVGSPPFSRKLCAWDVNDFEKLPVMYEIGDKARTEELSYHPFLPWVAFQGVDGVPLLFERESGNPLEDKVEQFDLVAGTQVLGLFFAPDGQGIVLATSVNDIVYLHRVALNLSQQEQKACIVGYRKLSQADSFGEGLSPSTLAAKVPLAGLHALRGGTNEKMTAKDVAQRFTDAVVVIENGNGSGTGMVVGADGYILTCAHCISGAGTIKVSYRRSVGDEIQQVTTEASLVKLDEAHDLALLKIDVPAPLPTIRFGLSAGLVNGEQVYVIGNPGVGSATFDHTITEGIISSAARQIGENTYIQTSASINPGSSGSPLFNENGLVVGQVVLKAKIEGAGFATPSDQLVHFLVENADLSNGMKLRREWIDSTGTHRVDATLENIAAEGVVLRKANGAAVVVPLQRLSEADRTLIEVLQSRLQQ